MMDNPKVKKYVSAALGMLCVLFGIFLLRRPYGMAVPLAALVAGIIALIMRRKRMQTGKRIKDMPAFIMRCAAIAMAAVLGLFLRDVALLALSVSFSAWLIVHGFRRVRKALRRKPFTLQAVPRVLFLRLRAGAALALAVVLCTASIVTYINTPRPDDFYRFDETIPSAPGVLLRIEPYQGGLPPNVKGYRILYSTASGENLVPAIASAVVFVPATDAPMPIVAWAHGTTGIAAHAAPSVENTPAAFTKTIPGFREAMENGWLIVAPDYAGLGTSGTHPYLIGLSTGYSVLDAIRAVRQLPGLRFSGEAVVWGHSQGGHAALWTGILAPDYASDINLTGVAAAAPATDLPALLEQSQNHIVGKVMGSYAICAYSDYYADVRLGAYIRPLMQPVVKSLAARSLSERAILVSVLTATAIDGPIYKRSPLEGAYGQRLLQNIPNRPIDASLFIAQGAEDPLVKPAIQDAFVAERRDAGQALTYTVYSGRDHASILEPDSQFVADLIAWTRASLAR